MEESLCFTCKTASRVRCPGLGPLPRIRHKKIEKVKIRATKIPHGFGKLSYEERLNRINITSLKDRRVRGDLIGMYKVVRGLDEIEWTKSPLLRTDIDLEGPAQGVRGNRLRLRREAFKSRVKNKFAKAVTLRHNFFTNRVVPRWNKLPETVVSAPSLVSFKSALDGHHKRFGCYGH